MFKAKASNAIIPQIKCIKTRIINGVGQIVVSIINQLCVTEAATTIPQKALQNKSIPSGLKYVVVNTKVKPIPKIKALTVAAILINSIIFI